MYKGRTERREKRRGYNVARHGIGATMRFSNGLLLGDIYRERERRCALLGQSFFFTELCFIEIEAIRENVWWKVKLVKCALEVGRHFDWS